MVWPIRLISFGAKSRVVLMLIADFLCVRSGFQTMYPVRTLTRFLLYIDNRRERARSKQGQYYGDAFSQPK